MSEWEKDLIEELRDPEFAKLYGAANAKDNFALTLLRARRKAKLTQEELAKKLGISQPYVAKLESGEANPTLGTVGSLLAVLGLGLVTSTEPLVPQPSTPSSVTRLFPDANAAVNIPATPAQAGRTLQEGYLCACGGAGQDDPISDTIPIWSREPIAGGVA